MARGPLELIDEKMDADGLDAFRSVSLADFLAGSGPRPEKLDLLSIVNQLADADVFMYLSPISRALADLADDSDEFAALVGKIAARTHHDVAQAPFVDMLTDMGTGKPGLAVGLARRLIGLGHPYHAAYLVGGAMRRSPAQCNDVADSLMRSKSDDEVAAGIRCLRTAWGRDGIADGAAEIRALAFALSLPDGEAAGEAMDALVDLYPLAGEEAGRMIEEMARRHGRCRSHLAERIQRCRASFDTATALRYLAMCVAGASDPPTTNRIYLALAKLSKEDPDAAVKAVADMFDILHPSEDMGHALQEIGSARPGSLTAAVLDKVSANYIPAADIRLPSIVCDIAKHADPNPILDVLFDALDSGGPATRPALRMINAMVTLNCDITHDSELASSTLRRLVRHAKTSGIDTKRLLKGERDAYLKSATIIRRLLDPPPEVDARRVTENMEMFPALKAAFGPSWLAKMSGTGQPPHPLVGCLSNLSLEKIESLRVQPPGETPGERCNRELRLNYASLPLETLSFLNRALALLDDAGMGGNKYVRHMKNPDQFMDTVSEIALVAAFVANQHPVTLEPSVGKKQLDAAVDLGPQRVLVEVFNPRMWGPVDLLEGSRGIPMGRAAGKIFDKVTEQLSALGACDDPIIVAIDTNRSEITQESVVDYVLGPLTYTVAFDTVAREGIGGSAGRDAGKCMHNLDARTDMVSAVVCFAPTMSADLSAAARGVIIENPHARVPLSPETRGMLAGILQGAPSGDGGRGGEPQ